MWLTSSGRINAPDEKRDVENISVQLFTPTSATASAELIAVSHAAQQGSVRDEPMKCIAVDWSGRAEVSDQQKHIWIAEAIGGQLVRLENGWTRNEVVDILVQAIQSQENLFIGLDFAFSFPQWYLKWRKLSGTRELWELAASEGEEWLSGHIWPFWGREGPYHKRPQDLETRLRFRQTEEELRSRGLQPKSVFQVYQPGAVGTATIRGLPFLIHLQDAGATIWPFDVPEVGRAIVVEIYPRRFYGNRVTNNQKAKGRDSRKSYLQSLYPHIEQHWRDAMISSDDAFDAGVSALVMSAHAGEFARLERATVPPKSLEGEIWSPS